MFLDGEGVGGGHLEPNLALQRLPNSFIYRMLLHWYNTNPSYHDVMILLPFVR